MIQDAPPSPLIKWPHPRGRKRTEPVTEAEPDLVRLVLEQFHLPMTPPHAAAASAAIAVVVKHHRQAVPATARPGPGSGPGRPSRRRRAAPGRAGQPLASPHCLSP